MSEGRRGRLRDGAARVAIAAEVLAIAWGALSFGAVYPWGYWPLAIASAAIGLLAFAIAPGSKSPSPRLALALGAIAAFMGLQLVRVPGTLLARWSPARDAFLKRYDVSHAISAGTLPHAISINADATLIALGCFVAFALLLLGTARLLSMTGAAPLVTGLIGFSLMLAFFGIAQDTLLTGHTGEFHKVYIYGFWLDPYVNKPFGPFINKNNFAGWMLLALPLALGFVAAKVAVFVRASHVDWRNSILWLGTADGVQALFAAVGALVMGIALVLSESRSGMIALMLALFVAAWFAPGRRRTGRARARALRVAILASFVFAVVAFAGTTVITERFADGTGATMMGRIGAWLDAQQIIADFPIVGTGLNTFSTAMVLYQRHDPYNVWEEAHNDYLQLVAEGGVILVVLVAVALACAMIEIRRRFQQESAAQSSTWIRFGAVTALVAIGFQELVEFSLQIPGNAALFAAVVGIALHRPAKLRRDPS